MSHPDLYANLPSEVQFYVYGKLSSKSKNGEKVASLVKSLDFKKDNTKEDNHVLEFYKYNCNSASTKWKTAVPHQKRKFSTLERRRLGLYKLGATLDYKKMRELNSLWQGYMRDVLRLDDIRRLGWNNSPEDSNFDQVSVKLYRADYHGCQLTITRSTCPSYVGITGIVAMETKFTFRLVCRDNVVKTILKKNSEFSFKLDDFEFSFYGSNFLTRPADRCSKKIKTIRMPDV